MILLLEEEEKPVVQVEPNPENSNGFFSKTNNFLANQMTNNDSKHINNRHVWIQGKVVTKCVFLRLPHRKCMWKFLIG